jgi:subtilisin family serine protease/regulation of enolase protein 1 (concanavalin A-like superfamily)
MRITARFTVRSLFIVGTLSALLAGCTRSTAEQGQTHPSVVTATTEEMKPAGATTTVALPPMVEAQVRPLPQSKEIAPTAIPQVKPAVIDAPVVDAALLAGTESDVIPPQIKAGRGDQILRVRLVRREGKFPLRRQEEILAMRNGVMEVVATTAMVADHFLVTVTPGQEPALAKNLANAGFAVRRILPGGLVALASFEYASHDAYGERRAHLATQPGIRTAESDFIVNAIGVPSDGEFANLWGMHNVGQGGGVVDADIDAVEAWDIHTGSQNVLVGVIDTGIDRNHPDLAANMWQNPGETGTDANGNAKQTNGLDDDANGYVDDWRGWDFVNGDNDPHDDHYHGTHCAGTIGGVGNNGQGVAGVCWNVSLVGLKFLDAGGSGTTSGAVEATLYATKIACTLTSNSWGGGGYSQALKDAIDAAGVAGILFVAAAGNSGMDTDASPNYPSTYESANIVAVAATDRYDGMAYFSNWGLTTVDLGAPGVDVYSAAPNGSYQYLSGTSMATPHVAGACALLKSANPSLSGAQIKQAIMATSDPISSLAGKTVTGGRLNVHRALLMVSGPVLTVQNKAIVDVGNNNGIINPGETAHVTITIASQGSEPLTGLVGTLSLSHPSLTLVDGSVSYGTVVTGSTSTGDGPFKIKVASGTVTPLVVEGLVTFTAASGGPWTTPVTLGVYTSATLSGTVQTKAGVSISGATVSWTGTSTGSVTTSATGTYTVSLVGGTYQVTASAATYAPSAPQSVTLPPNKSLAFTLGKPDIVLAPAQVNLTTPEGQVATMPLTITNAGDMPLTGTITAGSAWQADGLWHESAYRAVEGATSWYYGIEAQRNYNTGGTNSGGLTATITVPMANPVLTFSEWRQTEASSSYDLSLVQVAPVGGDSVSTTIGSTWNTIYQSFGTGGAWIPVNLDLSAYAGQQILIRFFFDTIDHIGNDYEGWYLDDVRVGGAPVTGWLSVAPTSFSIAANQNAVADVFGSAVNLPGGVYSSSLLVESNDPDQPSIQVPVTFTVVGSPILEPGATTWNDSAAPAVGDGDGWLEPGETVTALMAVHNKGSGNATSVISTLATADPYLSIVSAWIPYGDIAPGATATPGQPFEIAISTSCPTPYDAQVMLNTYFFDGSLYHGWAYPITLHVERRSTLSGTAKTTKGVVVGDAIISVVGIGSVMSAADGTYVMTGIPNGAFSVNAEKSAYLSATTTISVPPNAIWNPVLSTRQLTVTPAALTVRLARDKTVNKTLTLTSTGDLPVTWAIPEPWYPWLTRTPASGTVTTTKAVTLTFNSTGLPYGTYSQPVWVNSDDLDSPNVEVPLIFEVASANAPVAGELTLSTQEDTLLSFSYAGTDADGDPLSYEMLTQPSSGVVTDAGGAMWFTPESNMNGVVSFTYRAFDGFHYSAPATVTVTVTPVNDPPVLKPVAIVMTGTGSRTVTLEATDVDSPSVTIALAGQPAHGTATLLGTQLTYSLSSTYLGADSIPLTLDDGTVVISAAVLVSVTHPSFTWTTLGNGPSHSSVAPGALTNFAAPAQIWQNTFLGSVSSPAINNGLIYLSEGYYFTSLRLLAMPLASGDIAWERSFPAGFSLNPPTAVGDAVYVQRGNHASDSQLFKLNAISGETIWSAPFSAQWEEYLAPCVANGKVYVNGGSYGGLYAFDDATGVNDWFAYRPQYDDWTPAFANGRLFSWVDSSFIEHNPADGSTLWELTLPKQWAGYDMDTAPTIIGNVAIAIEYHSGALTAIDLTTKAIRFARTNGYYGVASGSGNNLFAYSATGVDEINLTTGALIRAYPSTYAPDSWSAGAKQPIVLSDALIFSVGSETVCYKRGNSTPQWSLPIGGALALAGPYLVITQGQQITTYRLPNRVPVFSGSTSYTIAEDTSASGSVSDADKDPLVVSVTTPPASGSVTTTTTGWKFQPAANWNGTVSFVLSATDGSAVVTRNVSVTVTPVNDAPVAQKQDLILIGASPLAVTLTATDIDSSTLTWLVASQPANGSLTGTAPTLTYTPKAGFTGKDSFTFTVSDGALTSAAATISISLLQALPEPWQTADVGTVGKTGLAGYDPAVQSFTVQGAGADIWGTADGFRFVYRTLTGDGQIVARVASQTNTNSWAKAGVMMRENLAVGSRHAMVVVTPGNGAAFQRRTTPGSTSLSTAKTGYVAPTWVKLTRKGNLFSSSVSSDGATWTPVGSSTIAMSASLSVGMAVTSHTTSSLSTVVFDRVSVAAAFTSQLNVDFMPVGSEQSPQFVPDHGTLFGLRPVGRDYGWNAVNNTTRDRNMLSYGADPMDTLIHTQKAPLVHAVWEIAVPDGTYYVHVGHGDPAYFDSIYETLVEGQIPTGGVPTSPYRLFESGGEVIVTDGRLTLSNGASAVNNKLTHVMIIPIPVGDG